MDFRARTLTLVIAASARARAAPAAEWQHYHDTGDEKLFIRQRHTTVLDPHRAG
jgi:hypothetical protein